MNKAFSTEVLADYIRKDLFSLECEHRQDKDRILEDLRWSFRQYGRASWPHHGGNLKRQDWVCA